VLSDVVLDTCVLAHANSRNPTIAALTEAAKDLLARVVQAPTAIAVDPGAEYPPDRATSRIWCEYRNTGALAYGTPAHDFLVALASQSRIREVEPKRLQHVRRWTGPGLDSLFVRVAAATRELRLVTHDDGYVTGELNARFGVTVQTCLECCQELGA
jgi:hypothetical protein